MPTIQINNEELEFEYIYYCDSVNGNDTRNGLTEATSLKTIQAAINKIVINTNSAIVLLPNSLFTGTVTSTGFINISANKQITFIGQLLNNDINTIPIIRSTEYNCIQNLSTKEINFINIRIDSLGSTSTGGAGLYALLLRMENASSTVNFYNCYLKPRGVIFFLAIVTNITVNVYNSIIDYNGHSFTYEVFFGPLNVNFYNTVVLGTMTSRNLTTGKTGYFYNSIVPSTNLTWHDFTSTTNKRLETSLSTIDSELQVALNTSYYINQGTGINPDETMAHIGIYGGIYAFGDWSELKTYFFFDNNKYKIYNTDTNLWSEIVITQPSDYMSYGMDSITGADITTLEDPDTITIKKYTTKLNDESLLYVRYKKTLLFSNPIDIKNVVNFHNFSMLLMNPAQGQIKFIISFDNINWYGLDKERYILTPVNNLTPSTQYEDVKEYGITNEDALYIDYGYDLPNIKSTSSKLYVAFYIENMDISSNIQLDSFHMICDYKQGYDAAIQTVDYIYNHTQNQTIVKLLTAGSYKINYFKKDIAVQVEENAIENSGVDSWNDLQNKPLFFTPTEHMHTIYDVDTLHNILNNKSNTIHNHTEEHTHEDYDAIEKISYVGIKPYFNGILWPGAEDRDGETFISLHDTPNTYDDTNEEFIKSNITNIVFEPLTLSVPSTDVVVSDTKSRRYSFLFGGG
jgi:hypothetical protein